MTKVAAIKLNKKFYSITAVRGASKAFEDIAKFHVRVSGDDYIVDISDCDGEYEISEIKGEFCNYVFHLCKIGSMFAHN